MGAYQPHAVRKDCPYCGAGFITHYYERIYCREQCKQNAAKKRKRLRDHVEERRVAPLETGLREAVQAQSEIMTDARLTAERELMARLKAEGKSIDEIADALDAMRRENEQGFVSPEADSAIAQFRRG